MPIYEYHCNPCDRKCELLISISKANSAECPVCGSKDMRKLMSLFSSRVAGSTSHGSDCAGCASGQCGSCNCSH